MSMLPAAFEAFRGEWRERTRAESRLLPQGKLSGPMPWVIAIMIGLTVVATASGLALRNTARVASVDVVGGVTVQIVHGAPKERDRQAQAALASVQSAPGVLSARLVPRPNSMRWSNRGLAPMRVTISTPCPCPR